MPRRGLQDTPMNGSRPHLGEVSANLRATSEPERRLCRPPTPGAQRDSPRACERRQLRLRLRHRLALAARIRSSPERRRERRHRLLLDRRSVASCRGRLGRLGRRTPHSYLRRLPRALLPLPPRPPRPLRRPPLIPCPPPVSLPPRLLLRLCRKSPRGAQTRPRAPPPASPPPPPRSGRTARAPAPSSTRPVRRRRSGEKRLAWRHRPTHRTAP